MLNDKTKKSPISLRETIYHVLRDDISYGMLSPGERLIEKDLAERFKASRSPIREAVRQLESEGLIEFERNKGITVSKLSVKQIDEIFALRSLLEGYAARLTAERAAKNDVTYLRDLQEKLKAAAKAHDSKSWLQNNTLFHDFFCEHAGNRTLALILDVLRRRIYRYRFIIALMLRKRDFEGFIKDHDCILKACEKNDGRIAEKHMMIHLEKTKRMLIDCLDSFPGL